MARLNPVRIPELSTLNYRNLKLIFVGDVGIGKSTFILRFLGWPVPDDVYHRTVGVDYTRVFFRLGEAEIKLNIFDFSGDPIYSALHCLMNRPDFVLLCHRNSSSLDSVNEYWRLVAESHSIPSTVYRLVDLSSGDPWEEFAAVAAVAAASSHQSSPL
jgi:GTPase SAR1 family protein